MEPDKQRPEMDDEMPPIDDELREAMEEMAHRLERFDRLQKLLVFLSVVCFGNVVGVGSLFANVLVSAAWGTHLTNKAEKLIGRAYPWIRFSVFYEYDKRSHSIPWARIKAEAREGGDQLTLRLMRLASAGREIGWCFAGVLGYIAALFLFGGIVTW